jgi:hypothetical protein
VDGNLKRGVAFEKRFHDFVFVIARR